MTPKWERVYTVDEFYDTPRFGVADCGGAPHVYRSLALDAAAGDWHDGRFALSPIAPEFATLAAEAGAIEERFSIAYYGGQLEEPERDEDWGALPGERARYDALRATLAPLLAVDPTRRFVRRGEFRGRAAAVPRPRGVICGSGFEVCWHADG
ncbi:hypothetical protein [Roseisolibacter sp. H3M3-2]|uniref:hypothetical protein n=1 Tax=Roseisolibacter sp. H3M3-2 TaxID=3031323 RepID=UPI0023DB2778|nr:hypothetical protein [Roseisolibacter sp. H3M3-2]MDF1501724.1 hypothetical protein [Roseisolibacter sp. H3M3-2]